MSLYKENINFPDIENIVESARHLYDAGEVTKAKEILLMLRDKLGDN